MKYLIDILVLIMLYVFVFYRKWKKKSKDILLINTLMYVYLCFVLFFTLMPIITRIPFIGDHTYIPMNSKPFVDLPAPKSFIDVPFKIESYKVQILLNVIMTIPFGFLFPLIKKENAKLYKTVICTFILSLSIELLQPLLNASRLSDITDIITNVLGGIIGYMIYFISKPMTKKALEYIKNR